MAMLSMEELDNLIIEEYDALIASNYNRPHHRSKRRKENISHKISDRNHGKTYLKRHNLNKLSCDELCYIHDKKAEDIALYNAKWIYTGKDGNNFLSKVWYTRNRKTKNDRLDRAMTEREKEYYLS